MSRSVKVILLLLLAPIGVAQQRTVSFNGSVVDAASNLPLPRTTLELRPVGGNPTQAYPGLSNDDGQFVFRNIPAGNYTLTAARNGYVRTDFGQRGPNGKGVPLSLSANQQPPQVRIAMTQSGAISGRISDPSGAPFPYIQIHAKRILYRESVRTLTTISSTYTNDLGEYRLWNLPPGQYVIAAEVNTGAQGILPASSTMIPPLPGGIVIDPITRGSMQAIPDPANLNQRRNSQILSGWKAPTYYRNAIDDRVATLIDLKPGNDLTGIDFVAGTISTLPVMITAPPDTQQMQLMFFPGQISSNVVFRPGNPIPALTWQVPPGPLTIGGSGTTNGNGSFITYSAIEVTPQNPAVVSLVAAPSLELSGRVTVEGQSNDADVGRLRIQFRRNPAIMGIPPVVVLPSAGSFSKTAMFVEGDYRIDVSGFGGSLNGAYVKSIRVRDTVLAGNALHIGGEALTGIEIIIGTRGGQIEGDALSNVVVTLVPDERSRLDLYKTITTDAAGHFRFDGITPGSYKLFSWEDVEPEAWFNPDSMRVQEDRGMVVKIGEGERQMTNPAVIPMR